MNILYIYIYHFYLHYRIIWWHDEHIYIYIWICVCESVSEEMWNDVVGGYESVLPTEKHDDTSPDYVESSSLFFQKSSESFARYFLLLGISITISWWIFFPCIHIFCCFSFIGLLSSEETQERRVFIKKCHVCGDGSWGWVVQSKNSDTTRRGSRPDTPPKKKIWY